MKEHPSTEEASTERSSLVEQVKRNAVALISLAVALAGLGVQHLA